MGRTPPTRFRFTLDPGSGVPFYRQMIDQVLAARATGALATGEQLPTVRQVAVDLSINPNTVVRAYRELEIRGVLSTQQGSGTFLTDQPVPPDVVARGRRLQQLAGECLARAGAEGFTREEMMQCLAEMTP